jgi:phosphoglycerate kinase
MNKQTVRDIDVRGKRVLERVDFNVPLDKVSGAISDDARIRGALPTIRFLLERGARLVLCSHLGRPDGKVVEKLSLKPCAVRLSELLGQPVAMAPDCVGLQTQAAVAALAPGQVVLLENLRFHAEEEANDPAFAKALASLGDVYVDDAFGTAHRAHASTEGVTHFLPAVAGFLMEKEIDYLGRALEAPERPFVAIIGGSKVSDKIGVLENLLGKVDSLLIGGGMANTFLLAQGFGVGKSLVESDKLDLARDILTKATAAKVKVLLPVDAVMADRFAADAAWRVVPVSEVPADWRILDIGPRTIIRFCEEIGSARTVVWNGPLGVFEFPAFSEGTVSIAKALAKIHATTIIGGGDSASAVEQVGVADRMSHISTGGGASLEFLEGKTLPGVAALLDK